MTIKQLVRSLIVLAIAGISIVSAFAGPNTVQFEPVTYTAPENSGSVVLRVTASRNGNTSDVITVNYASANGSAIAGQDYDAVSGTLTFPAGVTEQSITVNIINDPTPEGPEKFTVNLSNPAGASLGSTPSSSVTIADDDSATSTIQFDQSSYTVNEGDGSVRVVFTRSGGLNTAASVTYSTSDNTTTAGSDYAASSGTVSFPVGSVRQTIAIPIFDDQIQESSETFSAALGLPSPNAVLGAPQSTTITIVDNDSASTVQFSPGTYTVSEAAGQVTLTVVANRLGDPNTTITVQYVTRDGSASYGQDYTYTAGSVAFLPGQTIQSISVPITNDTSLENSENFFVDLFSPTNAGLKTDGSSTATVAISDDDSPTASIGFTASSYSVDEGAGSAVLTVTRSGGLSFFATVNYATTDGTAVAGRNYASTSGSVTFAPGETSKTISVPIIDEGSVDPTLQFTVTLTDANGTGFVGGQSSATVNILDNDANTFRFRSAAYSVGERSGSVTLTVDVQRSGDPAQEISVDYVTTDGTAQAGAKYTRTAGRLIFGANVTSQTITVPILDEPFIEGSTTFNVVLSNPLPATTQDGNARSRLGSPSSAVVTIFDDDARTFQFTSSSYAVANSSGAVNLTVTFNRAATSDGTYTVDYATSDGSGIAGRDYTPAAGRLTFQPGEFSKTITIQIVQQPAGQPTRQFQVDLFNPSGGAIVGAPGSATVSITNPDFSTKLLNISTRGPVQFGDDVMIAGFIIRGDSSKTLVLRGIGPSLTSYGIADAIGDPTLTLNDANGTPLAYNDDYITNSSRDRQTLNENGLMPADSRESAVVTTLGGGIYTAGLRGKAKGIGMVELYDISGGVSTNVVNISTRGKVEQGDNGAMIAGFIVGAPDKQPGVAQRVVIRAIAPSLKSYGVSDALQDPTLEVYRGSQKILLNDNWKSNTPADQQALQSSGLAPTNDKEAAIIISLDPGSYTAVIRGKNNTTGVALAEVYNLGQ